MRSNIFLAVIACGMSFSAIANIARIEYAEFKVKRVGRTDQYQLCINPDSPNGCMDDESSAKTFIRVDGFDRVFLQSRAYGYTLEIGKLDVSKQLVELNTAEFVLVEAQGCPGKDFTINDLDLMDQCNTWMIIKKNRNQAVGKYYYISPANLNRGNVPPLDDRDPNRRFPRGGY